VFTLKVHSFKRIGFRASSQTEKPGEAQGSDAITLFRRKTTISAFFRVLRTYQWTKNFLVFIPLIASQNFLSLGLLVRGLVAFLSISLCASAVYVINDLIDIESDRRHHSKRNRPFASGELSLSLGLLMAPVLLGLGISLAFFLPKVTILVLLTYVLLSTAYTLWLKKKLVADVVTLAMLYTVRIVLGGVATSIVVSPWLLAFSIFLFVSLAFSKRVTEIIRISCPGQQGVPGRAYLLADTSTLAGLGAQSGSLASLVLALYINSPDVRELYSHPAWLWLLVPLLLYWIGRFWIRTMRGEMTDDPILFLFKDRATHLTVILGCVILFLATKCPFRILGILK
jgi:4-hydroxybenzoate polyprenyltransferase